MNGSLVRQAVMSWSAMLGLVFVTAVVFGLQSIIYGAIADNTVVVEDATCTMTSINPGEEEGGFLGSDIPPSMHVDCNGTEYEIENTLLIVSYLQKPQPLICSISQLDQANCRLQEQDS